MDIIGSHIGTTSASRGHQGKQSAELGQFRITEIKHPGCWWEGWNQQLTTLRTRPFLRVARHSTEMSGTSQNAVYAQCTRSRLLRRKREPFCNRAVLYGWRVIRAE